MQGELERLEQMYGELGDEHLRDLADDRDSLTADGQMALARVLAARGLADGPPKQKDMERSAAGQGAAEQGEELEQGFAPGIPGVVPSGAEAMERALEHGGQRKDGMVRLVSFFDGHELTRACNALEAADYDFALEPLERDELEGAPTSFAVWVDEQDRSAAEDVLRQKMGLFPKSEVEGEDGAVYDDSPVTLGEFETPAEAERVKQLLAAAGIACQMVSGEDSHGEAWYEIEVQGTDLERGLAAAAPALAGGASDAVV